jgi:hypothetical protein
MVLSCIQFWSRFAYKQNTKHLTSHPAVPWGRWVNVSEHLLIAASVCEHLFQPSAAGQTLKWRPFMKKFERHIRSQSKLHCLFWNLRSKLTLWRVYLEGGDTRALAHTRAQQVRFEKSVPLCTSKFWRQICIQTQHPALEIEASCTFRAVSKRPWACNLAPQAKL